MVDFPEPEGPTMATVFPGFNEKLMPFNTSTSGLEGYANFTSEKINSLLNRFLDGLLLEVVSQKVQLHRGCL